VEDEEISRITMLLKECRRGDEAACDRLGPLVYAAQNRSRLYAPGARWNRIAGFSLISV
jgi:hypothetical protein